MPPLISVRAFTGSAGLMGLFATPLSLRQVTLNGLTIHVPPGGIRTGGATDSSPAPAADAADVRESRLPSLVIERITADDARVEIASRNPRKEPRRFDIHDLVMHGFRPDAPADFKAVLTNPVPRGDIDTSGAFGPWLAATPARTAVRGRFVFKHADLDTIKGLGGILSSTGEYSGVLERIAVERGHRHA